MYYYYVSMDATVEITSLPSDDQAKGERLFALFSGDGLTRDLLITLVTMGKEGGLDTRTGKLNHALWQRYAQSVEMKNGVPAFRYHAGIVLKDAVAYAATVLSNIRNFGDKIQQILPAIFAESAVESN